MYKVGDIVRARRFEPLLGRPGQVERIEANVLFVRAPGCPSPFNAEGLWLLLEEEVISLPPLMAFTAGLDIE